MNKIFQILFLVVVVFALPFCQPHNNTPNIDDSTDPSVDQPANVDTIKAEGFERVRYGVNYDNFSNPERGFYRHLQWTNSNGSVTSDMTFNTYRNDGGSLLLNIYYITDYKSRDLDEAFLSLFQRQMDAVRKNGFKVVLRFAYSDNMTNTGVNAFDAPLEQVLVHIEQLKPYLRANADVIAVVECGFIGAWGEWYYTSNFGMGAFINWSRRSQVVQALLDALPKDRMVCMRTPGYKLSFLNISPLSHLTMADAHNGSDKARLAYHNDCFLASASDQGTFFSEAEREYNKADSKFVAMGGETCAVSEYSGCDNALAQMKAYHWSYLNIMYRGEVINGWKTNNCFDEIQRSLGYRFQLEFLDKPEEIKRGDMCEIKMYINNTGFAAPYNPRKSYLLLIDNQDNVGYIHNMNSDVRYWFAGEANFIKEKIEIPSTLEAGQYKLVLWMPDMYDSIKDNPYYSIRLATNNVWNQTKGYNELTTLVIQ